MGNSNSSENTRRSNWKLFKVIGKTENSGYTRYHLSDYVTYSNGNYKHVDFDTRVVGTNGAIALAGFLVGYPALERFDFPREGYYVKIDLEQTRNLNSGYEFSGFSSSAVKVVGKEEIDSDGNVSIMAATRDLCEEIIECRQRYARAAEYSRWVNQTQA